MSADVAEFTLQTRSADETIDVGRAIGQATKPGDVLVLTGDLGAGKTQLTKGIARGMGVVGEVTSPTFTIEMVYEGEHMPLYHFDLYRLDDPDELEDTGIFDVLGGDGVCAIEWGEQFADEIGEERVDVFLTRAEDSAAAGAVLGVFDGSMAGEPAREIRLVAHDTRGCELIASVRNILE